MKNYVSQNFTCNKAHIHTVYLFGNHLSNRYFNSFLFENKFLILFTRIKVMQQCFFVNWSVFLVPWKYETFPSIQVFFAKLRGNFSPSPARQKGTLFLRRVLVVVITTDNNEYFSSYNIMMKKFQSLSNTTSKVLSTKARFETKKLELRILLVNSTVLTKLFTKWNVQSGYDK